MLRVMPQEWAEDQARTIAAEIRRLRGGRSAQWLADRTKALGHHVTRSVIADLENGRRKYVTTAELIVLAAALNTAPVALVFPGPYDADIQLLPKEGQLWKAIWAVEWFSGLMDGATVLSVSDDLAEYDQNLARLRLAREVWELDGRKWGLLHQIQESHNSDDPDRKLTEAQVSEIYAEVGRLQQRAAELMSSEVWRGDGR
jgi:hypothetical protein